MREIKFRAWDKKHSKMVFCDESCQPDFCISMNGKVLVNTDNGACEDPGCCGEFREYMTDDEAENFELMQFAGLKDKNGKEIYEGDVVAFDHTKMRVIWHECGFIFWQKGWSEIHNVNSQAEVIGNIYENPELLK